MFEGFMYEDRALKCSLIMEFKDITVLKERVIAYISLNEKHA